MKVVIFGAGRVGREIARYLIYENVDVVIVEKNPTTVARLSESMDVQCICGNAALPDIQLQAGIGSADILIAVTKSDEVNIVCSQIGHHLFSVPVKIVRLRQQSYIEDKWAKIFGPGKLPIDVIISPEKAISQAIHRRIHTRGAFDVIPFVDDLVRVVGVKCQENCPVLNTPLRQLSQLFPDLSLTILSIVRDDVPLIPDADEPMLAGDYVYFSVETTHMARAMQAFGYEDKETRNLLIIGGGAVGRRLAIEMKEKERFSELTMVEINPTIARNLAEALPGVSIITGDILDNSVLNNLNLKSFDAAVTVTEDDELNTLAILMLKGRGVERGISLNKNTVYNSLIGKLGVDVVVNPGAITISQILQYIRHGQIHAAHALHGGLFEVFEATALPTSTLVGVPLREAHLPKGIVIGAVIREKTVFMARPQTVIRENDTVVLMAQHADVAKVEKLFAVSATFF